MLALEEAFECKPWCEETLSQNWHECTMRMRLYDRRDYVAEDVVVSLDPEFAEQRALLARFTPPVAHLINLFVMDGQEDGDPVDMAIELWRVAKDVDEPSAVIPLDLQGLKDLHKAVGQAIALLEE